MSIISPKIEIINHYDNLINRLDIDIEHSLEKFKEEQILSQVLQASESDRKNYEKKYTILSVKFHDSTIDLSKNIDKYQTADLSTKVLDYLRYQVRMRTIEELRKAQKDSLEYYKLNSAHFKDQLTEEKNIDQLKSELFAESFYYQIQLTKKNLLAFSIFTFATDFYMSQFDINTLE